MLHGTKAPFLAPKNKFKTASQGFRGPGLRCERLVRVSPRRRDISGETGAVVWKKWYTKDLAEARHLVMVRCAPVKREPLFREWVAGYEYPHFKCT